MEKKYLMATFAVFVMAAFVIGVNINNSSPVATAHEEVGITGFPCIYLNDVLIECKENTVMTNGLNYVKTSLGVGTVNNIKDLALGNTTAPVVGDTALPGIYTTNGLGKAVGTYNTNGDGNWSIAYTWTSLGDGIIVNTTGLYKTADAAGLFAGTSYKATTLQTDDQLKVNYTLSVS